MVKAQGGDVSVIEDPQNFKKAPVQYEVLADRSGYLTKMDTEGIGIASCMLGAGRETLESQIDYSAGIVLKKKTGDFVAKGEVLAVLHTSLRERLKGAEARFRQALSFSAEPVEKQALILGRVE